ncbi:MAG: aminopeptidase P family protein [Chloroflexi bacterium]|jgi:Xaa-Pro dipeptidase|nr:aminopeptidase P family protein [Chloroflexota bacterium]
MDQTRLERLQKMMAGEDLAALVCRLSENVVYLTDYWPHHGFSVAVLPREGRPLALVPEVEQEYAEQSWAEVTPFGWGLLKDGDMYVSFRKWLQELVQKLGLKGKKIGVEKSFEITGPTYRAAEPVVPAGPWHSLLEDVFAESELVDANDLLSTAKAIKGEYELEKMRIANEIAEMGIRYALEKLEPGMTEAQVGALIEYKIRADGPGCKGARLVRASAEVAAGPVDSTKGTLLIPSTGYQLKEGDFVMVELATVVDGYWSDLTHMAVVGEPSDRQKEVYNTVLEAQQAAAALMRQGAAFTDPDRAAREVLEKAGLGEYFVHITGHGVGFRYHEFIPVLAPGLEGVLEKGMVSSVEPGVYIPDFGGVRIEDNVAVGESGPVFLSTPREPW